LTKEIVLMFSTIRRASPFAAAAMAVLAAALPAAAYTPVTSNLPGPFTIADSSSQPSVRCVIESDPPSDPNPIVIGTYKMKIYPPKMWAKSNASKVSWQYQIRRNEDPFYPGWTTKYTSTPQNDTATTSTAANSFTPRTWNVPSNGHPDEIFTVRILMKWRNNSNVVKGSATIELEWYRETGQYGSGDIYELPCYRVTGQA
jgi:hypothetical protein